MSGPRHTGSRPDASGRRARRLRGPRRRDPRAGASRSRATALATRPCVRGRSGQAAVEVVALLPLLAAVALAVLQALAAGVASELAGHAAHSGAVALAEGGDAAAAARAAVPGWSRASVAVTVRGSRVEVRLTPPALVPGLGARLAATAGADAGAVP
jgi:hypothetical protein